MSERSSNVGNSPGDAASRSRERNSNVGYSPPGELARLSRERNSYAGYSPGDTTRASRDSHGGGGPGATDVEFDIFIRRNEFDYPAWWTRRRLVQNFFSLCEDPYWNSIICIMALAGIVWVAIKLNYMVFTVLDIMYNISYAVHIFGLTYSLLMRMEASEFTLYKSGFLYQGPSSVDQDEDRRPAQ